MMVRMRISTIRRSRFSYKFTNGLAYVPHSATVLSRWASEYNEARSVPSKVQRARNARLQDGRGPTGRGAPQKAPARFAHGVIVRT